MSGVQREHTWPVPVAGLGGVHVGTVMWTFQGQPHLTAAVKATYLIGADGTLDGPVASPVLPVELSDRPNEVVPALTQAEIHVRTAATGIFHLAVYQGRQALLTKSAATSDLALVPPADSSRQAMAGVRGERLIQLPNDFAWEALHAAPSDQRVPRLAGDEWIVFGFDEQPPQRVRLPGVRAEVRAFGKKAPSFSSAALDMVLVDVDARQLSLVWRARAHVKDAFRLASLKVVGRLDSGPPFGDTAPVDVEAKGTYLETSPPATTSASPLPPEAATTALQSTMATSGPAPDTALPFDPGMAPKIEVIPAAATPSRHPTGTGAMPAISKEDVLSAVRPPTAAAPTSPLVETADVPAGGADLGGTMFGSAPTGAAVPFAEPSSPPAPGRSSPPPPASPWAGDEPSTRGAPPSAQGAPPAVARPPRAPAPPAVPPAPPPTAGKAPAPPPTAGKPPAPPPTAGKAPAPPPTAGKPAPPAASALAEAPPPPSAPSAEELAARERAREEARQQRKREVEAELRAIREEAEEMRKEEERLRTEAQRREERARIEEEQRRQAEQEEALKARMAKRAAQHDAERERAGRLRAMLYGFRTK